MADEMALLNMPKTTKIGPVEWMILPDKETTRDWDYWGVTLPRSRRIKIDSDIPNTQLPLTFLHEILHALGCMYEVNYWENHTTNDKGEHTDKIGMMASSLLMWIQDNPEIIKWLQEYK